MITRTIPGDYIGTLIGPGGKNIQELQKTSGCSLVINEDPDVCWSIILSVIEYSNKLFNRSHLGASTISVANNAKTP